MSKSKAKQRKQKSKSKIKKPKEKDPALLRFLLHRLASEARLAKHQRSILPLMLRAKIDSAADSLALQRKRLASANIALAEALYSALTIKSLDPMEKAEMVKMIVGFVRTVADRNPECVTPQARMAAEAIMGRSLEEVLRDDVDDFFANPGEGFEIDNEMASRFAKEIKHARSPVDLERLGAEARRKIDPACVGDLEYFARKLPHEPQSMDAAKEALKILEGVFHRVTDAQRAASNVIHLSVAASSANLTLVKDTFDVIGMLDDIAANPGVGSLDKFVDLLGQSERKILINGLAAQRNMKQFEIDAILSHPDCEVISEFVEDFSGLATFDPARQMLAMAEREIYITRTALDIVHNRSARAVKALLADYYEFAEEHEDFGDDLDDGEWADDDDQSHTDWPFNV